MQVFGNIANTLEKHTGKTSGKEFYTFRLAENQGKDDQRTTTWYDVTAFISELDADLLSKGQFVKVTGRLEVKAFARKDGTPGASANILAYKVEIVERKQRADGPDQGSGGYEGE